MALLKRATLTYLLLAFVLQAYLGLDAVLGVLETPLDDAREEQTKEDADSVGTRVDCHQHQDIL